MPPIPKAKSPPNAPKEMWRNPGLANCQFGFCIRTKIIINREAIGSRMPLARIRFTC